MSKINEVANLVLDDLSSNGDSQTALDPATVAIIVEGIIALIEAIKECRQNADDAVSIIQNPSRLQIVAANMKMRRQMGIREFRSHGRQMVRSMVSTGQRLTEGDIRELYDEV